MDLDRALSGRGGHGGVQALLFGDGRAPLHDTLESMIGPGQTVRACRLRRAKFKPGRWLAANFDVSLRNVRQPIPVAATWYMAGVPARTPELAAAFEQLRKDAVPTAFDRLFAVVPSSRMLVQVAPLDPSFPGLGWLSDPRRAPAAAAACAARVDGSSGRYGVRPIRYRPGKRHVLQYTVPGGPGFFVKVYRAGGQGSVARTVTALADVLDSAEVGGVRVARPAAVWADVGAILYHQAPGTPLSRQLHAGGSVGASLFRQIGRMLRGIHASPPPAGSSLRERSLDGEVAAVSRACLALQVLRPEWWDGAARLVERAQEGLESLERETATVVHGDMKADHLLAGPDGVVVLDGDRCALADPALDVGKFLADLRWWSVAGSGFGVADAEAEVLAGYASPGPRLDRARLYSALMLVKMAGRRVSVARRDWAARTTTLLALAGQALDGGTDR